MKFYENSFTVSSEKSVDEIVSYLLVNCAVKNSNPFEEPLDISSYAHYCKIEWNTIYFGWTAYPGVEIEGLMQPLDAATIITCRLVGFQLNLILNSGLSVIWIIAFISAFSTQDHISSAMPFFCLSIGIPAFRLNKLRKELIFKKKAFIDFIQKS